MSNDNKNNRPIKTYGKGNPKGSLFFNDTQYGRMPVLQINNVYEDPNNSGQYKSKTGYSQKEAEKLRTIVSAASTDMLKDEQQLIREQELSEPEVDDHDEPER